MYIPSCSWGHVVHLNAHLTKLNEHYMFMLFQAWYIVLVEAVLNLKNRILAKDISWL